MSQQDEEIRTIDDAAATLRGLIREAHAATKDLRKATEAAREVVEDGVARAVRQRLASEVKAGWEEYSDQVSAAIVASTDAVYERFDSIFGILVGRRKPTDLPTLIHQKIEAGEIDVDDLLRRERSLRVRISRTAGEEWQAQRETLGRES